MQTLKKNIRTNILENNRLLPASYKEMADLAIKKNLEGISAYAQAKIIFIYVSMADEVNTHKLIDQALEAEKRVLVPKNIQKGIMGAFEIKSRMDLEDGYFGTQEPKEGAPLIEKEKIQFAVIPCVTVDKNGYRVGYGGGYYDRYLDNTRFPTAVLCREKGMVERTPRADHDIKIDMVISEIGTIVT